MQPPLPIGAPALTTPSFYLTGRQPLRPGAILLATVAVLGGLSTILYGLSHNGSAHPGHGGSGADQSASAAAATAAHDDDDDDPNQIDTIVLGDPADAPVPARKGNHVSPVHPTILIRLPRFGDQVGLIPDTPAGRLLYGWLAAFNQGSESALGNALPNAAPGFTAAAQMELRRQTGGFSLLSAKEARPDVLVFRLRDQTPLGTEVLGTLQLRPDTIPAAIASFSLRGITAARQEGAAGAPTAPLPSTVTRP